MRRRVPVQNLRGSDPTLLEVQLQDLLRRPMGQLALVNVLDLITLAETEGRPRSLERSLTTFVERIRGSIADLPLGAPWEEFLGELEEIEGSRVPNRFRDMLAAEAERSDRNPERVAALLSSWSDQEPEPFPLGQTKARVTRAAPAEPSEERAERRGPSRTRAPSRKASGTSRAKTVTVEDRERQEWIADLVLERLHGATESGLAETVLVAGIRHRARERYPTLTPVEITTVLKQLKETGRVRYSAGRWSTPTRW